MKNRFNRHPALERSQRFKHEAQALRHATRDPVIAAMYDSSEWQRLRAQVRHAAGGMCQWPRCTRAGYCVDHRTPHKGDPALFYSLGNLWLLCKIHHDRKTARYDGGFGREVKEVPQFWPMAGRPKG